MSYMHSEDMFRQAATMLRAGRINDATGVCRKAVAQYPNDARMLALLGALCLQQGKAEECIRWLERSLAQNPNQPDALSNYAVACEQLSRPAEALEKIDQALALQPDNAQALSNRCNFLNLLSRPEEALAAIEKAFACGANGFGAYINRGNALRGLLRFEEALANYNIALSMAPNSLITINNRGHVLRVLGRAEEALEAFDAVVRLSPYASEGYIGRGNALSDLGRYEEAKAAYDNALMLKPDLADAKWNKAMVCLLTEDFDQGWALYEARWQGSVLSKAVRHFPQPKLTDKTDLRGKRVLIYAEQGLGDTVQFCRYIPMLEARGAKVVLEVQPPLKTLISTLPGKVKCFARGEKLPKSDYQAALMSLPYVCHTRLETIPGEVPYLAAEPRKIAAWGHKLGPKQKPRIGLCWSGRGGLTPDYTRSMPAKFLAPLMDLPLEFHCLQKEIRPEDAKVIAAWPIITHMEDFTDFAETAALMALMDVVISVDTSVAHVAGAIGRKVWLMIPQAGEWRWLRDRSDSPWYPTMTIFRQPGWGDWAGSIAAVRDKLMAL